ncbi:MAG: hypothetical protein ACE14P_12010 [Methanotrichaceae archaeon]
MKGVALIIAVLIFGVIVSLGSPSIKEPVQYEELGSGLNVSGTDIFEKFRIAYSGISPLIGSKSLSSKSVFNGIWTTDTSWHKLFDNNINSHQSFARQFEIDRQVKLHEWATHRSTIECMKTPSSFNVRAGDVITFEYNIYNPSDTVITGIRLVDSDLGRIKLARTALGPDESTKGAATYTVTEDDILAGPRETIATVTGVDNMNERVESHSGSWLVPIAEYYEGNAFSAPICPKCENCEQSNDSRSCARCEIAPGSFNLYKGNLTLYALNVNMTESRYPLPDCPYKRWQSPEASAVVEFGATSDTEANTADPIDSVWQSLSLEPGAYQAGQAYRSIVEGVVPGGTYSWNTPYEGPSPSGGFHCTGDPQYDSFDLKMVLTDLGPGAGLRADTYQRVYKSSDRSENAYEWREIGSQEVPEDVMDKAAIRPFILVTNARNSTGGGTISWSRIIAAD